MSKSIRKIDRLGRIVLPMEIRKSLKIKENDELDVALDNGCIVIYPHIRVCKICGSKQIENKEFLLCKNCVEAVKRL